MMELKKQRIYTNRRKGSVTAQVTLDDDFNVPDSMDDVDQLVMDSGEIQMESVRNLGEKVQLRGKLAFRALYRTPGRTMMTLAGAIPFEETINMPGLAEQDHVQVHWELDDLNIGLINSRKLSVQALVTLHILAESLCDAEVAAGIAAGGAHIEALEREIEVAVQKVRRKDTYRIKEVLNVPGNRPDIDKLLWQDMKLRSVTTKPLDGRIHVEGELVVFLVYSGGDAQMPVQCLEESIGFSGDVELAESDEDMIPFIAVRLMHRDVEVTPDSDGEMREIAVDAVLELDIRLYEEETYEILSDLYALDREIQPELGELCYDRIAMKNVLRQKIQEKFSLPMEPRILQVCHSDGTVKVDEVQIREDGIHIDGILEAEILYMTADDGAPMAAFRQMIPFHAMTEVPGLTAESEYRIEPGIEQISAVMLGGGTVEVKAAATLEILVLTPVCETIIRNVKEAPLDMEKLKRMPGIVGYVVQPGDTLWKIAREFHTSVDEIMATNQMGESTIHPGDKLILVKAMREPVHAGVHG